MGGWSAGIGILRAFEKTGIYVAPFLVSPRRTEKKNLSTEQTGGDRGRILVGTGEEQSIPNGVTWGGAWMICAKTGLLGTIGVLQIVILHAETRSE